MQENELQYSKYGNVWIPCGITQRTMPPGFYNLMPTNAGMGLELAKPVADELIDIPGTPADDVMEDINKFLATKERYIKCGLTHKRGYLFYGPPGSGKTSLGLMIGRRFIRDVGGLVFYISSAGELSHATEIMRKVEPGRPTMYLMEEADRIVDNTVALSILDGELSLAGAVFVAMTNYKEQLPPRIANRPGRFDRVMFIDAPPLRVQIEYLKRLTVRAEVDEIAAINIGETLVGLPVSMAHLREAFIAHVLMGVDLATMRKRFEVMMDRAVAAPAEEGEDDDDDGDPDDDCCTVCWDNDCGGCVEENEHMKGLVKQDAAAS